MMRRTTYEVKRSAFSRAASRALVLRRRARAVTARHAQTPPQHAQ